MKQVAGIWLPDWEAHLLPFLEDEQNWVEGHGTYQRHKLLRALSYVKAHRRAVDVGAHVGLWSMELARRFESVIAFEPLEAHCECFERNVDMSRTMLLPCALGAKNDRVSMRTTVDSSGESRIAGHGDLPMRRYDDIELDKKPVDFMKVDCEGYELFVLQGAEQMLRRNRPVVVVEQKPGRAQRYGLGETDAVQWLEGLGATLRETIAGDYILSW